MSTMRPARELFIFIPTSPIRGLGVAALGSNPGFRTHFLIHDGREKKKKKGGSSYQRKRVAVRRLRTGTRKHPHFRAWGLRRADPGGREAREEPGAGDGQPSLEGFRGGRLARHPISLLQFSSVAQSCPTLCDPMNCSVPGLPVHHQLPEFTQTHVNRVGDAIQPSHPLSSPSPAPNPSQHQSLFQ